jgi:hypothetical protein
MLLEGIRQQEEMVYCLQYGSGGPPDAYMSSCETSRLMPFTFGRQ